MYKKEVKKRMRCKEGGDTNGDLFSYVCLGWLVWCVYVEQWLTFANEALLYEAPEHVAAVVAVRGLVKGLLQEGMAERRDAARRRLVDGRARHDDAHHSAARRGPFGLL